MQSNEQQHYYWDGSSDEHSKEYWLKGTKNKVIKEMNYRKAFLTVFPKWKLFSMQELSEMMLAELDGTF